MASSGAGGGGGGGGPREFFAVRAAKWIGGVAQKATAAIARVAAGPSAQALRSELEAKAAGPPEARPALLSEWARLLSASDDTPRYEEPDGGSALTFRAAFLGSQAWEIIFAATAREIAEGRTAAVANGAAWRCFLRAVAVAGGEELAGQLPELLAEAWHFPDCRQRVEEGAVALKSDAKHEVLRSHCTVAGSRAEEIRTGLRRAAAAGSAAGGGEGAAEERSRASAEAVRLYASFREGLAGCAAHLREVLAQRCAALATAGEALRAVAAGSEQQHAAAVAKREEAARSRDEAVAAPRKALEALERDGQRLATEAQARQFEAQRRELQMELEQVAQALAGKRQEHQALHLRLERAVAEHRRQAEGIERQLQELRPALFHGVVTPRAEHMTEGEIVLSLARGAEAVQGLAGRVAEGAREAGGRRAEELETQRRTVEQQSQQFLRKHAKLELARLEVAGTAIAESVSALLDVARSRAEFAAMGVSPDREDLYGLSSLPDRRDVKRLRGALRDAKEAWEEAVGFWSSEDGEVGPATALAAAGAEPLADEVLAQLEAARGRITHILVPLQRADPALYDLAVLGGRGEDEDFAGEGGSTADGLPPEAANLPHGWEAHVAESGHIYYNNLVSTQTQWEMPSQDAAVSAGWRLFQAESGEWFYHNPYDGSGVWWPELPKGPAEPSSVDALRREVG